MSTQQQSEFIPIKGFDNYYVSKDGRIVNRSNKSLTLKYDSTKQKYVVKFKINKKEYTRNLDYIILSTFYHDSVMGIIHKDGDEENYHFDNLMYGPIYAVKNASIPVFYEDSAIQEMNIKHVIDEKLLKDYNDNYYSYVEDNYRYYIPKKDGNPTYYSYIKRFDSINSAVNILNEQTDDDIRNKLYHTAILNTYYADKYTYYGYHWKFLDCIETWYQHPTLTDYEFSSESRCRTVKEKFLKKIEYQWNNDSKKFIKLEFSSLCKRLHICVLEAFTNTYDNDNYIVEHIDGDKHNNRYENLRFTTSTEKSQNNTQRTYEDFYYPIIATSGTEQYTFSSIDEVIDELFQNERAKRETIRGKINASIRNNTNYKGYVFSIDWYIEDEEWRYVSEKFEELQNFQVSDYGKIWTPGASYPTYGYKTDDGSRKIKRNKQYLVHHLVAYTFIGEPKFDNQVVKHINGDKTDNKLSNLKFSKK